MCHVSRLEKKSEEYRSIRDALVPMLALKPPSQSLVREPPTVCPRGRVCACTGQLVRHPFPPRGCSAWCNVFCGSSDCNVFLYYEIAHTNTDTTCGAIKPSAFLALHIIVGHAPSGAGLYGTRSVRWEGASTIVSQNRASAIAKIRWWEALRKFQL